MQHAHAFGPTEMVGLLIGASSDKIGAGFRESLCTGACGHAVAFGVVVSRAPIHERIVNVRTSASVNVENVGLLRLCEKRRRRPDRA